MIQDDSKENKSLFFIKKFLEGVDSWNKWIFNNQHATIDFSGIKFSDYMQEGTSTIDFTGFNFPSNGSVIFDGADFGDYNVNFTMSHFTGDLVSFISTNFRKGSLFFEFTHIHCRKFLFQNVTFQTGDIIFNQAQFYNCVADFSNCIFGTGQAQFSGAYFGDDVIFCGSSFGGEILDFSESIFEEKKTVEFSGSKFLCKINSFNGANFKSKEVHFTGSIFGGDQTSFVSCSFGSSFTYFTGVSFITSELLFTGAEFHGAIFHDAKMHSKQIYFDYVSFLGHVTFLGSTVSSDTKITFQYSNFHKSFEFSEEATLCSVPDFRGTKTNQHFEVSKIHYKLNRKKFGFGVVDSNDGERLCRLKEIAESNKDFQSALKLNADELRAKRWSRKFTSSLLDLSFSVTSNYGLSILRPVSLFLVTFIAMTLYTIRYAIPTPINGESLLLWIEQMETIDSKTIFASIQYTLSHLIPFLGGIQEHGKSAKNELSHLLPDNYGLVSILFSIPSYIFLFLIGLGLRNRFRI